MSLRKEFVTAARREGANISALCRTYGISRKTGYKWLHRYAAAGEEGLCDRSRRPHHSPHQTPEAVEDAIVQLRKENPAWGARKLKRRLEDQGHQDLPAVSTITEVLRRRECLDPDECAKHRAYQHFEHAAPNELLQMDFKGSFDLSGGEACHSLTVLDDHSRYLLGLFACTNQRYETVRQALTQVFQHYGVPQRMLMDNGEPWKGGPRAPYSQLTVWLMRLGVCVSHGRYYHPQTQGKDERLHRTLGAEVLRERTFATLTDCQTAYDRWRHKYNHQRPHEALDLDTPAQHYQPSERPFPPALPEIVYPPGDPVRLVDTSGKFYFRNVQFRFSKAFRRQPIQLCPTDDPDRFDIRFMAHKIAFLSFSDEDVQYLPVTHVPEHV
jgi:transposase InsO family protein